VHRVVEPAAKEDKVSQVTLWSAMDEHRKVVAVCICAERHDSIERTLAGA
jgi:hypothetical protein